MVQTQKLLLNEIVIICIDHVSSWVDTMQKVIEKFTKGHQPQQLIVRTEHPLLGKGQDVTVKAEEYKQAQSERSRTKG